MNIKAKIITVLFYSSESIKISSLAKNFNIDKDIILKMIDDANNDLKKMGLIIISDKNEAQLVALPEYTKTIEEFYDSTPQPLSQPALETLSVIAYKQPISKDEVDEIRGVSSEQSIRNLLSKKLIEKAVKNNVTKYKTTIEFLKLMGLESLKQLDNYDANK